jgi:hypothetical protein
VETKAQRGNRTEWERERRSVLAPTDCATLLKTGRFRMCDSSTTTTTSISILLFSSSSSSCQFC